MAEFAVVLVEPKYEGNIGSAARVMNNFGFRELVLVKPPEIGREARKMAMHSHDILESAKIVNSLEDVKDDFDVIVGTSAVIATEKNVRRTPITPDQLGNSVNAKGKVAILFGREDYGLLNEEIDLCDLLVTIPANPEYPTLNLAQSVAVLLYELRKLSFKEKLLKKKKRYDLDGKEKDILLESYGALVDLVHTEDFRRRLAKKTFKEMLGRAFVSRAEATTLIGIFKRVRRKIKNE
jgi:TrmH family RNA methyltransferase